MLAALVACSGSEHQVFQPLVNLSPPSVDPPAPTIAEDGADDGSPEAGSEAPDPAQDAPDLQPRGEILDPNITFDWTPSLPGQGTCKAGVYTGRFNCVMDTFPPWPLDGKLSFTLEGSPEQQRLTVTEGGISDLADAVFSAGVDGSLNCIDQRFEAQTVDGMAATLPPIDQPFAPTFRLFEATMVGNFDDQELVITGSWHLVNDLGDTCTGSFFAGATP